MLIMRLARFRILDVMEFWVPALCALLLAAVSLPAMAQTACPVGATPGSVVCGPDPVAAQSQGPSVPFQRLDGYGAMAWSADAGLTYTETRNGGEGTDRAVVNGALEYCRSAGNGDCVIKLTWENACQLAPLDMSDLRRSFAPAGQSTQMIIGATGESDYTLLQTTQQLYQGFDLKRVFYSAYIPLNEDPVLPEIGTPPPLLREHRLYQADWLLRFYGFQADELLTIEKPNFNELLDPKCDWALRHLELFPVEVETASYAELLRVPGVGPKSASRIVNARRYGRMDFTSLKKMGVVLKRAHYFITCGGKQMYHTPLEETYITRQLVSVDRKESWEMAHANEGFSQMTLADFGIG